MHVVLLDFCGRLISYGLTQGGDKKDSQESYELQKRYFKGKNTKNAISSEDRGKRYATYYLVLFLFSSTLLV